MKSSTTEYSNENIKTNYQIKQPKYWKHVYQINKIIETIYGTTKFEFYKFTYTKESSAILEVVKKSYYHSNHFDLK